MILYFFSCAFLSLSDFVEKLDSFSDDVDTLDTNTTDTADIIVDDTADTTDTADTNVDDTVLDQDGDGYTVENGDCDDHSANANPEVFDIFGDGIDLNCDGVDGIDADQDGFSSLESGGEDCDDTRNDVFPSAEDTWYDGIDSNCDGSSDYDQDGDGFDSIQYGGEDCDDLDDTIWPNVFEILNDSLDNNCDGVDSICTLTNCDFGLDLGIEQTMDFVLVPHGIFMMGSPSTEAGRNSDETQHQVTLTHDFYVMTTEVTQGMFYQLMGYHAYVGEQDSYPLGEGDNYPVSFVSWDMAAYYANRVTQHHNNIYQTSLQECYTCGTFGSGCIETMSPYICTGYRLLTEAEWEYAARAGTTNPYGTPNNVALSQYSWYGNQTGTGTLHPVAQLVANGYGLYDMSGNVWEWVHDYYGEYTTSPVTDPVQMSGLYRVFRGGSYSNDPNNIRSARRAYYTPTYRNGAVGFRLGFSP